MTGNKKSSSLPRILFVPQTKRNYAMLRLYAEALSAKYEILYLRTTIFGDNCDIGIDANGGHDRIEGPEFLVQRRSGNLREIQLWFLQWRRHAAFCDYLKNLGLSLAVIGVDANGIGHWTASLCRSLGISTVVCQEGIPWDFAHDPFIISVKRALINMLSFLVYPHAGFSKFFRIAEYVTTWGKFTRDKCILIGVSPDRISIVGDPRIKPRSAARPYDDASVIRLLFLDVPVHTLSKGVFDTSAHIALRKELIELTKIGKYHLIYKPHPFTRREELNSIRQLINNQSSIELVETGIAEDLYARADACLTFPSTSISSILAFGLPLIQIYPHYTGFKRPMIDTNSELCIGFTIRQISQIHDILRKIRTSEWRDRYWQDSRIIAEEIVGPLDGKAPERFAQTVELILKNKRT